MLTEDDQAAALASTICAELFGTGVTSIDAEDLFNERYKGRRVHWSGELEWVDAMGADLHFGADSVARGVLRVCEPTPGLLGGGPVRAHVILTGVTSGDLRQHVGRRLAFQGRLNDCDAFARNIYIADARLMEQ